MLYASDDAYDGYDGYDLLPEVRGKFVFDSPFARSEANYLTRLAASHIDTPDRRLKVGACQVDRPPPAAAGAARAAGGAWWSTQRVGPFTTFGGGERVQVGWEDAANLGGALDEARASGGSLGVVAHAASPVDADGGALVGRPLHTHHIELVPGRGATYRDWGNWHCVVSPDEHCFPLHTLLAAYGDGGLRSYDVGAEHYAKLFDQPLSLRAEISDTRPAGAPPLVWYVQVVVRVQSLPPRGATRRGGALAAPRPEPPAAALSVHAAHNPMWICPGQLGCARQSLRVPASGDSFFFYTGRMPAAGRLVSGFVHARARDYLHASLLFDATPQQVGFPDQPWPLMPRPRLWPRVAFEAMTPSAEGFDDNEALLTHILAAMRDEQQAARRGEGDARGRHHPRLICAAGAVPRVGHGDGVGVGGFGPQGDGDARCVEWHFQRLQPYTVVSTHRAPAGAPTSGADWDGGGDDEGHRHRRREPDGPTAAEDRGHATRPWPDGVFQRDVWHLDYVAADGLSRYTVDFGSAVPDALANATAGGRSIYSWNLMHLYLYRGTPMSTPTLFTMLCHALLVLHYAADEFHAALFLHPRQWGLVTDSIGLNAALILPLALFALVLPLLLYFSARLLVSAEAYSLRAVTKADGSSSSSSGLDVLRLLQGVCATCGSVIMLLLTAASLAFLFVGWGQYDAIYFVGVLGPSTSLDLLPFMSYFIGYVVGYWTEAYAIRTGRRPPVVRASTALSFPDLGRFPILPTAALIAAAGQYASAPQFALLRIAGAGRAGIWSWVLYKPIVSLSTVAFNATVVYYSGAIRASRFAFLQQGKRIFVVAAADAAARQHRRVIWFGAVALTCANVAVLGLGTPWLLASRPADAADDVAADAVDAADAGGGGGGGVPVVGGAQLDVLASRVVPLHLAAVDLLVTTFALPLAATLVSAAACAALIRDGRLSRVPDCALVYTGAIFGWHRLPATSRGLLYGGCCAALHAAPLLGWLGLTGCRAIAADDYLWWKAAFVLVLSVLYVPRAIYWGLAAASLKLKRAPGGGSGVGVGVGGVGGGPPDAYGRLDEEADGADEEIDGSDDDDDDSDDDRGLNDEGDSDDDIMGSAAGVAVAPPLRAPGDETAKAPPRVHDGSPRSCWGDLCVASLVALAASALFARLLAFADLAVPLIIEEGAAKAIARLAHEARANGGPPRDAAAHVMLADQALLCALVLALAFLLRARRVVVLLCALVSPAAALAVLLIDLYPRGEERHLSAARLVAERDAAGRTALAGRLCAAVGVLAALAPLQLARGFAATHGHFNYMDVLREGAETPYAAVAWREDLVRLACLTLSLLLAFRYVTASALLPQRLYFLDILPLKSWVLPALVLLLATPTAAIALSLWMHLRRFLGRVAPEVPEEEEAKAAAAEAAAADGKAAAAAQPGREEAKPNPICSDTNGRATATVGAVVAGQPPRAFAKGGHEHHGAGLHGAIIASSPAAAAAAAAAAAVAASAPAGAPAAAAPSDASHPPASMAPPNRLHRAVSGVI